MKCLLVIAHPSPDSLNAALAETAAEALRKAGHDLTIRNLYEQGFQPVLSAMELKEIAAGAAPAAVAVEAEELRNAEALVLVFPTWWFSLPAMLKGWFDRVWAPGVAYELTEKGLLAPRLSKLRCALAITTLGTPWWIDWLVLRRPVKRVLKFAMLKTCAPKARFEFLAFYGCDSLQAPQVKRMKARVLGAIGRIA